MLRLEKRIFPVFTNVCLTLLLCGSFHFAGAQDSFVDSLKKSLKTLPPDTNRVEALLKYARFYYFTKPDSCRIIAGEALSLAREINFKTGEVQALNVMAEASRFTGDYPAAIKLNTEALRLNREMKDPFAEAITLGFLGFTYMEFKEYRKALEYMFAARLLNQNTKNQLKETFDLTNIGNTYGLLGMPDSALYFQRKAYVTYQGLTHGPLKSLILTRLGAAHTMMNNRDSALIYYHYALENSIRVNDGVNNSKVKRMLAKHFELTNYDSSLYYAREGFANAKKSGQLLELLETSEILTKLFRVKKNTDSAFYYQDVAKSMSDSLYGPAKFRQLQLLMLEEQQNNQNTIRKQEEFKNRSKLIALLSVVGVLLIMGIILLWNNTQKQKAKIKIERAYKELKNTQSQLIQREKMASLGELTAGIAHEIQNPLNFVNNFSEVNKELISEMNAELEAGNIHEARSISKNIEDNEEKIIAHGKRADAIVKNMLQHSRMSNGKKEPVDINALADEYLRLSYHGLRAKDKTFNAKFETDFDPEVGNINVVSQDIGRVLLNLVNNAFYAVTDKKNNQPSTNYEPIVRVNTRKQEDKVVITVSDNGGGIPKHVLDKIFQPFFTTKPAGEGTGLGLSLAYDIITKGHGGELKVKTNEGEGSEFIIIIPTT